MPVTLTGRTAGATQVVVGDVAVLLHEDELELLVRVLETLDGPDAAAVTDDVRALRLVGGTIYLTPTEREREVLRRAAVLAAVRTSNRPLLLFARALRDRRTGRREPV